MSVHATRRRFHERAWRSLIHVLSVMLLALIAFLLLSSQPAGAQPLSRLRLLAAGAEAVDQPALIGLKA